MRSPQDLSASDGNIVLAELSEQYPPLVSTIGMATRIKNYYRRPEVHRFNSITLNISLYVFLFVSLS